MSKEDMKKWIKIILVALAGYLIVSNVAVVGNIIGKIMNIISPFVVGAAIAFILNVPMSFFERKLGSLKSKKGKKLNKNFIRTISLVLAILVIVFILSLIIKLIVPEIVNIVSLLIENFPYYAEEIKSFATTLTEDYPEVTDIINNIEIEREQIKVKDCVIILAITKENEILIEGGLTSLPRTSKAKVGMDLTIECRILDPEDKTKCTQVGNKMNKTLFKECKEKVKIRSGSYCLINSYSSLIFLGVNTSIPYLSATSLQGEGVNIAFLPTNLSSLVTTKTMLNPALINPSKT